MSRAFVKEDAEAAPVVPRRAPLPEGVHNYVTPRGLRLLREELAALHESLVARERAEGAGRSDSAALRERIAELEGRIASAEPIDATAGLPGVVRFGARVTVRGEDGGERSYQLVGVDEANAADGRVAFLSPLARAVLGKRVGDVVAWRTPRGEEELELVAIDFEPEP